MAGYRVDICGINTKELPLISSSEGRELLSKIKQGDEQARETFIRGNLRLVLSIVQRFSNNNENLDDLFQIGCIGMLKAIDNFDTTLGLQFSTYAVPMIIGEIKRYLRDNNSIRVSRSMRDTAYKAIYTREQLSKKGQKEPTITEIANEIGIPKEEIIQALDAIQTPISLYEPVYNDGGEPLYIMDQVSDCKNTEDNWVKHIAIRESLDKLPSREKQIIKMRFFDCKTQTEVADEIGISQAQVSRLEKCALVRMKNELST